ncbi:MULTISPECIES: ATP-binding protein [Streptomyces]|uniref:histidine kinase n=1 Tax=Streptomyces viridochromogenes TaxID=1938 RepID=A0A0L8L6Y2_STRVR|nr:MULTISPECIES: ATP-binding protein [Streptomyces]KOG33831.1 histidine kinase [Streptomyces viridochromogenes]
MRVLVGAAAGVGKTYRMLDEGHRRAARGTDVVVGAADCRGRPHTEALLHGLERLERPEHASGNRPGGGLGYGSGRDPASAPVRDPGGAPGTFDLDTALRRRPELLLLDDLARTNPPGHRNARRWQDVEELLAAGIDVVSTIDVQHLESLSDVVERITEVPPGETVPDGFVRRADQIVLVDVDPEELRRRMAHGNVHPPEMVDAALAGWFRPGNLTALRELALLWVADRVDDALRTYRSDHGIAGVWEARERVVVGLTGGPEGDTLIRRAGRIAARSAHGELSAVHVVGGDGLAAGASSGALARQRRLVESIGGSYHTVVGEDVPTALVEFARASDATQLVLGTSRRGRLERFLTGRGIGETAVTLSGGIDVHMVTHERAGRGRLLPSLRRTLPLPRRIAGPLAGVVLPVLLTLLLDRARGSLNLTSEALLFLVTVVGVACFGGIGSALVAAVTASLLLNYWFMPPIGAFSFGDPDSVLVLGVFVLVAGIVAAIVDRSLRLSRRASRATAEAETLSALAGSVVRGEHTVPALLARTRETFGAHAVELVDHPVDDPAASQVALGDGGFLVLRGRTLPAAERRVLTAFAAHVTAAVERARLAEAAAEAEPVKAADRMRTALLAAVSHDLRTPLAAGWAAVASLRNPDVDFSAEDRDELLATADESMARLSRLVENLLDMSRLQAGALALDLRPTAWEEVVPAALDGLPDAEHRVTLDGLEHSPLVLADPPLLERVVANLVANAVRHSPPGRGVRLGASTLSGRVELRVADRGPGLPAADRDRVFEPFQRLGDTDNTTGVGLGLALARGLTEAMGGTLTAEDTPGGGLTMVVTLPGADSRMPGAPAHADS